MIGTLGPVIFYTSEQSMRTFTDFQRSEGGRWATHDRMLQKPASEFLGPELGTISFNIRFDVQYGMNPRKEMDKLLSMVRNGETYVLVIGGKGLGMKRWSLQKVVQKWEHVDNRGNLLVSNLSVSLEEYV
ncbi:MULTISPECIES: phage tail protein [Pontibacillus]|uniref:Phage tail protein n=1 Tax=Pontibacillus chungwhensis TaxID=265426 RepID=A0ABY8V0I9_9BACI|nr:MULTISPECIES: phage tail protein [Pontibacillus]MCD5324783.1 phage tail protein [Pontibacillus sp. HN14]WIF98742.1 phage tail protein [Pontibacillus chungwhensis]